MSPNESLIAAAEKCDLDGVKAALSQGADVNYRNQDGCAALHLAAAPFEEVLEQHLPYLDLLKCLIDTPGIFLDIADSDDKTPLDYALEYGMDDCAELLEKSGASHGLEWQLECAEDYIRSCGEYSNDDEFESLVELARDSIVTQWRTTH